jgi:hypothetical protein
MGALQSNALIDCNGLTFLCGELTARTTPLLISSNQWAVRTTIWALWFHVTIRDLSGRHVSAYVVIRGVNNCDNKQFARMPSARRDDGGFTRFCLVREYLYLKKKHGKTSLFC